MRLHLGLPCCVQAAAAAAAEAIWLEGHVLLLALLLLPLHVLSACAADNAATAAVMASDCDVSISSLEAVSRSRSCCTAVICSKSEPNSVLSMFKAGWMCEWTYASPTR
jgi:hypothetical protein